MITGDITLTITTPDAISALEKAATKYGEALRIFGLKCHSTDTTERNQAAGAVYECRREFLARLHAIRDGGAA